MELGPVYLPDLDVNNKVLRYLEYNLDENNGYLLRIKEDSPLPGKNLVATKLDIYPTQREE